MSKSTATTASLTLLLAGCSQLPIDPELACRDRIVTVNHAAAFIDARPEYVGICAGQTLTVRIRPPVGDDAARTRQDPGNAPVQPGRRDPGQPSAPWLDVDSDNGRDIIIEIPADVEMDAIFKYRIEIDGVGTIDPRVRIIGRGG